MASTGIMDKMTIFYSRIMRPEDEQGWKRYARLFLDIASCIGSQMSKISAFLVTMKQHTWLMPCIRPCYQKHSQKERSCTDGGTHALVESLHRDWKDSWLNGEFAKFGEFGEIFVSFGELTEPEEMVIGECKHLVITIFFSFQFFIRL